MSKYAGSIIKGFGIFVCAIGILGCVLLGCQYIGKEELKIGLLTILIGIPVSSIGGCLIYAFGDIIDTLHDINDTLDSIHKKMK